MALRLSDLAVADIKAAWSHVAIENPAAADRLVDTLHEKEAQLTGQPRLGRERIDLGVGIRCWPAGNYLIFYEVSGFEIDIIRVVHGARDIPELFRKRP